MQLLARQVVSRLRALVGLDRARFEGHVLPPREMRFCGSHFKDDAYFLESARREADRLIERCGLAEGGRVLDVGCGPGRLAIGLLDRLDDRLGAYRGVDVDPVSIAWCRRHLEPRREGFRFSVREVHNARYNPAGEGSTSLRRELGDETFDVIYLYSVFSHLLVPDVECYLDDFAGLLAPRGTLFLTAFVEEGVPDVEENPSGYRRRWKGPLHCVRYDRAYFESLLASRRLELHDFDYETETDGQSALYIRHLGSAESGQSAAG